MGCPPSMGRDGGVVPECRLRQQARGASRGRGAMLGHAGCGVRLKSCPHGLWLWAWVIGWDGRPCAGSDVGDVPECRPRQQARDASRGRGAMPGLAGWDGPPTCCPDVLKPYDGLSARPGTLHAAQSSKYNSRDLLAATACLWGSGPSRYVGSEVPAQAGEAQRAVPLDPFLLHDASLALARPG